AAMAGSLHLSRLFMTRNTAIRPRLKTSTRSFGSTVKVLSLHWGHGAAHLFPVAARAFGARGALRRTSIVLVRLNPATSYRNLSCFSNDGIKVSSREENWNSRRSLARPRRISSSARALPPVRSGTEVLQHALESLRRSEERRVGKECRSGW